MVEKLFNQKASCRAQSPLNDGGPRKYLATIASDAAFTTARIDGWNETATFKPVSGFKLVSVSQGCTGSVGITVADEI